MNTYKTRKQQMELRSCPLCGTKSSVTKLEHAGGKPTYNIACGSKDDGSDTCGLVLFGGNDIKRKDMIARWNHRVQDK